MASTKGSAGSVGLLTAGRLPRGAQLAALQRADWRQALLDNREPVDADIAAELLGSHMSAKHASTLMYRSTSPGTLGALLATNQVAAKTLDVALDRWVMAPDDATQFTNHLVRIGARRAKGIIVKMLGRSDFSPADKLRVLTTSGSDPSTKFIKFRWNALDANHDDAVNFIEHVTAETISDVTPTALGAVAVIAANIPATRETFLANPHTAPALVSATLTPEECDSLLDTAEHRGTQAPHIWADVLALICNQWWSTPAAVQRATTLLEQPDLRNAYIACGRHSARLAPCDPALMTKEQMLQAASVTWPGLHVLDPSVEWARRMLNNPRFDLDVAIAARHHLETDTEALATKIATLDGDTTTRTQLIGQLNSTQTARVCTWKPVAATAVNPQQSRFMFGSVTSYAAFSPHDLRCDLSIMHWGTNSATEAAAHAHTVLGDNVEAWTTLLVLLDTVTEGTTFDELCETAGTLQHQPAHS